MDRMFKGMAVFQDRYPLIGPTFWILSVQYYLTQLLVSLAWSPPYHFSWLQNTISDLGNTACGQYGSRLVCSPQHNWMNASFVLLGATMIAGSSLINHEFQRSRASAVGFSFMALAGLGTAFVGFFPENTIGTLHELGAFLPFFLGNVALIIFGLALGLPKPLKYFSVISGATALLALALFLTHNYLGIGIGGMERITAYPQSIWMTVFGLYMSRSHFQKRKRKHNS